MNSFDPKTHSYTMNDVPVPSVTQVLTETGIVDDKWYTPEGKKRGQAVHLATEYLDRETLNWESIHKKIRAYVEAYQKFKKENNFEPDKIEQRVFNNTYYYAGTLDRTGTFQNQKILLDIKSGELPKWVGLQLAGYEHCLKGLYPRFALQLKPDGTYKLRECKDKNDLNLFLNCVAITHWKRNQKGGI